jgi:hypothetical protein
MNDDAERIRFSATIGRGGTISVPAEAVSRFGRGRAVQVTIARDPRAGSRRRVAADEDEVAWIAALQAEPAAVIRRCLEAQGALPGFRARAQGARRRLSGRRTAGGARKR